MRIECDLGGERYVRSRLLSTAFFHPSFSSFMSVFLSLVSHSLSFCLLSTCFWSVDRDSTWNSHIVRTHRYPQEYNRYLRPVGWQLSRERLYNLRPQSSTFDVLDVFPSSRLRISHLPSYFVLSHKLSLSIHIVQCIVPTQWLVRSHTYHARNFTFAHPSPLSTGLCTGHIGVLV